jgi:hypothetical protein
MAVQLVFDKSPLEIKIPMKPFLVKFLYSKFGQHHKASKTTWLGISATNLLTDVYSKPIKVRDTCNFTLLIPYQMCLQKGHFINYNAIPEFKQNVERVFRDFMHEFIKINSKDKSYGEITRSLKRFLEYYNIAEDELKLDSAYRHYTRSIKEKENRTKNNSLNKKSA